MSKPVEIEPAVRLWELSDIKELKPDVEYAAIFCYRTSEPDLSAFTRPFMLVWAHGILVMIEDPVAGETMQLVNGPPGWSLWVVGRWDGPMQPDGWFVGQEPTWRQYAAHQLGQVLRQRDLAERLTDFGVKRLPEAYLPPMQPGNAVERSLVLNFDEMDRLLRAAGF